MKYFIHLVIILLSSCCFQNSSDGTNDENDTIFFNRLKLPAYMEKSLKNESDLLWQTVINDKIIINIYDFVNRKYFLFIKEITCTKINRFVLESTDRLAYSIPGYDSLQDDLILLYDTSKIIHTYSSKLLKAHLLRFEDTTFQNNIKRTTDLKKLEEILNNLDVLQNFHLSDLQQVDIVKRLFILTQMQILKLNHYCNTIDRLNFILRNFDVEEIKTQKDLQKFRERLAMHPTDIDTVIKTWKLQNQKYITTKLASIEKDFKRNNIFYFYEYNDLQVFKLEIKQKNGKIYLKKEHINKEFNWIFENYPEKIPFF